MIASAMPGILPRLTSEEAVQLTRIYSAAGDLKADGLAVTPTAYESCSPYSIQTINCWRRKWRTVTR